MDELYVSKVTICATTKCNKKFSCLSGTSEELCSVDYCMNKSLAFVTCVDEVDCNYRTRYGDSMICLCPVRIELYSKYEV